MTLFVARLQSSCATVNFISGTVSPFGRPIFPSLCIQTCHAACCRSQGGWISGSGRLRDDPYTIVRASSDDDSANVNEDVQVVSPPSAAPSSPSSVSLSSSDQHPSASSSRRNPASSSNQQRKNERTPRRQQFSARNKDSVASESSGRHEKAETGSGGQNAAQSQGIPDRRGPCAGERVRPTEKSRGFRSPAGLPSGSPLPTQRRSASKVLPRPSPAVGSFGRPTSPSAKEMEANDTGDKVTCPVCQRGMDHWKTGQRQQVIPTAGQDAHVDTRV